MELRAVEYALAVADTLHFGRAAELVRVAQPSLSRQIAALEREIGATLFDRTSRRVALTEAGAQFFPAARKAIAELDAGARRARQAEHGQRGQLRLGFVATAALDLLPEVMAQLRARRPNVRVHLTECTTGQQVSQILDGELDVGIGRDVAAEPGLHVDVIGQESMCLAVAEHHRLAERRSITLDEVVGEAVVRLPRGVAPRADVLLSLIAGQHRGTEAIEQEANHYLTLLALVSAGLGVACVPDHVRQLRSDGVRYLQIRHPEAVTSLTLARRDSDSTPMVRGFCDLVFNSWASADTGSVQEGRDSSTR